jgi:hypothetical protein
LKHFISRNVQLQRWCMWDFRLSQQCSWDLCSSGTKYHVTRRLVLLLQTEVVPTPTWTETSAFVTADTLDSNSIKLCWQSHAKIYKTLDKKLLKSFYWSQGGPRSKHALYKKHRLLHQQPVARCIDYLSSRCTGNWLLFICYMLKKTRACTITLLTALQMS